MEDMSREEIDKSLVLESDFDVPSFDGKKIFVRLNKANDSRITSYNVCYTKLLRLNSRIIANSRCPAIFYIEALKKRKNLVRFFIQILL